MTNVEQILNAAGTEVASSITMSIAGHDIELVSEQESGSSVYGRNGVDYGTTSYYPFFIPGAVSRNASSFSVHGRDFSLHSEAFVIPRLTTIDAQYLNVTIAVPSGQTCADFQTVVSVPVTQPATLAPKIVTYNVSLDQIREEIDSYNICSDSKIFQQLPRGLVTIRILKGENLIDVFLIGGEAAGW